ncbi:hypothetical protein [Mycolicibacterium sphagni]|uniref:Uncharacterized protein n=1 Tax=Mycolicibacterium sphagni TaxID=1786 RepID=A0A255DR01_9MYCO|nr:hypothetical protein [Mycolicibacterium sphagni]OYN81786.1 hypothetical protein CG716_05440 [Mycolicibacterium sphagni]
MNADINDFVAGAFTGAAGAKIIFTLNVGGLVKVTDTERISLLSVKPVVGYIRSDGRMYDSPAISASPFDVGDPGKLGVRLLANAATFLYPGDVSYHVVGYRLVDGVMTKFIEFYTGAVPASDSAANLADFMPNPAAPEGAVKFKDPNARLDFGVDWGGALLGGDVIVSSTWIISETNDGILVIDDDSFTATRATVWLTGGAVGFTYKVTNRIVTAAGRIDDWTLRVKILDQ